jgi:uncharacterized glyoxalase superfamily protein PhnB
MTTKVVPMIHVPDVHAVVAWYQSIGFALQRTHEEGGSLSWASLTFGSTEVMFNEGGKPSNAQRREVDLYLHVENVDVLFADLKDRVEIVERAHNTDHGMREFIIRDPNGFWIVFGQPLSS